MLERLTCESCVHFRPPANEGEPGHCYGVPPQIITIGKGEDTRTRRSQPETEAADVACPHHPGHAAWTKLAIAARQNEQQQDCASERVRDALSSIDPRFGRNCACVRLGHGEGSPGRVRIDLPEGRHVSVLHRCKFCKGTGVVEGVDPNRVLKVENNGQPLSDLELAAFPFHEYAGQDFNVQQSAALEWITGEPIEAEATSEV